MIWNCPSEVVGDPVKDLLALADGYVKFVGWNLNRWALVMEHQSAGDEPLPEWFHQKVDQLLSLIERALTPLFGKPAKANIREAARVLWSSFHGIWSLAGSGKLSVITDQSSKAMTHSLVVNYVTGLRVNLEESA